MIKNINISLVLPLLIMCSMFNGFGCFFNYHHQKLNNEKQILVKDGQFSYCNKASGSCITIQELTIQDSISTKTNCNSTLEVEMSIKEKPDQNTIAYGYLTQSGRILNNPGFKNNCNRTKIFTINATHVILTFGEIPHVVFFKDIGELVLNILWHHDKIYFILTKCNYYDEIQGGFKLLYIIKDIFLVPYSIVIFYIIKWLIRILKSIMRLVVNLLKILMNVLKDAEYYCNLLEIKSKKFSIDKGLKQHKNQETLQNQIYYHVYNKGKCQFCQKNFQRLQSHEPYCPMKQ